MTILTGILIIVGMLLSWWFGYDTGWIRGLEDRGRGKKIR